MRLLGIFLLAAVLVPAQQPDLQRLLSRPLLWGTWPTRLAWARHANVLGFLWNDHGGAFHDLYVYDAGAGKLTRLTNLADVKDPINDSPAELDVHRKNYLPPPTGLSAFNLSDDGKQAVFTYRGDIYLVATSGGPVDRLTKTKAHESEPRFSSDGSRIAFTEGGQLYVLTLGGLLAQKTDIKSPASLDGYEWSPDGKYLCYVVSPKPERTMLLPNYSGQFVTAPSFPRSVAGDSLEAGEMFIVDSSGDAPPRRIDIEKGQLLSQFQWSRDSKKLLLVTQSPDFKSQEIRIVNVSLPVSTAVFHQTDSRWIEMADTGWDLDSNRIWFTSDQSGFKHLYVVDINGQHLRQLTSGNWEIHNDTFSHAPEWVNHYIYFSSTQGDPSERQTYRVDVDSKTAPEQVSHHPGLNIGFPSDDGTRLALLQADPANPFDIYVDGNRVTKSPLPEFYKVQWPEMRYLSYPSLKDGKPVAARLILPPGYRPEDPNQAPRPAIVYIHGAGYATSVLKQWGSYQEFRFAFNNYLANRGYVILEMDYRGSTGYGRDWRSGVYLNMAGPDLDDVLGGVEYLRSLKNVDMHNIGIWGWSYGGFMTAAALFKSPGVFKAGAAFSGVYDWLNYNAGYTGERLTTPFENPEAYRRSSPITFSNQLQDHLLIVHGIIDDNVLFQDAVQLSEKLIHEHKPYEEAFYPEESHAYVRDESYSDAFSRAAAFFDRYLHAQQ